MGKMRFSFNSGQMGYNYNSIYVEIDPIHNTFDSGHMSNISYSGLMDL